MISGSFLSVSFLEMALFIFSKVLLILSKLIDISFFLAVSSFKLPLDNRSSIDAAFFSPQEFKISVITKIEYIFFMVI